MPSPETAIWMALKAAIQQVVFVPDMPVIDPDATFTPPEDDNGPLPFVLCSDIRNDNRAVTIDRLTTEVNGVLLLTICWPVARPWAVGTPSIPHAAFLQMAAPIFDVFTAGASFPYDGVCLTITRRPDILGPELDGAYRQLRVRVHWWTFVRQ